MVTHGFQPQKTMGSKQQSMVMGGDGGRFTGTYGSRAALSTVAGSSAAFGRLPSLNTTSRAGNAPAKRNYCNVELFKIPDVKFKAFRRNMSTTLKEAHESYYDSSLYQEAVSTEGFEPPEPEQIVQQALEEAVIQRQNRTEGIKLFNSRQRNIKNARMSMPANAHDRGQFLDLEKRSPTYRNKFKAGRGSMGATLAADAGGITPDIRTIAAGTSTARGRAPPLNRASPDFSNHNFPKTGGPASFSKTYTSAINYKRQKEGLPQLKEFATGPVLHM